MMKEWNSSKLRAFQIGFNNLLGTDSQ